jgi:hypothetical protein
MKERARGGERGEVWKKYEQKSPQKFEEMSSNRSPVDVMSK